MLVDQRRYRLGKSTELVRLLRLFLPREDLVFVLDAPPEIIHQRKQELSIEELERQRDALRKLAQSSARYVLVPAEGSPEEIAAAVCRKIVEKLAFRTQCNIGSLPVMSMGAAHSWRDLFSGSPEDMPIVLRTLKKNGHDFLVLPVEARPRSPLAKSLSGANIPSHAYGA